jgi:hypothetical protein
MSSLSMSLSKAKKKDKNAFIDFSITQKYPYKFEKIKIKNCFYFFLTDIFFYLKTDLKKIIKMIFFKRTIFI